MEEIPISSIQDQQDQASIVRRPYLSAIPEVDSFVEESILNNNTHPGHSESPSPTRNDYLTSPHRRETVTTHSAVSPAHVREGPKKHSESWSYQMPDDMFKIKNLDTGEVIDIRDETKDKFITDFARVVNLDKANFSELEVF